jgi:dihydrofolate reductase
VSLDLRFERLIAARPERVFDAFTDPEGQREFYGQDDPGWIVESRCDLRVGGVWSIRFVTDGVESAMAQAKQAAGDAGVLVHGAELAQSCLRAGVLDELEIHLIPILLGEGRPLFAGLGAEHVPLELTRVVDAPGVTHLHNRVGS